MERISLTDGSMTDAVNRAVAVIRAGGVILYPTETLYGLGADALSDDAVDRVYRVKARDLKKPMHSLVSDAAMADRYGMLDDRARALMQIEAVSLIVPKKPACASGICRSIDTFGFRLAQPIFCAALLVATGTPITTTSANRAGRLPERSIDAILEQLGDTTRFIDLVIDAGELPEKAPSTLVDLSRGEVQIVREGAVPAERITESLASI